jgi:hypothetical protein
MNSKNKMIVVQYEEQYWRTFDILPDDGFAGYGPSGVNLCIYFPKDNSILNWANWSGLSNDIKNLKKQKCMWCYRASVKAPV